jgi:hypothetical protein
MPMRPRKYPWDISVGAAFFAPGRTSTSIQSDVRKYHAPRKYKCRKVAIKGVVGVKVMRIA